MQLVEDAVSLVDVLAPPDCVLRAPIGLSNGQVCGHGWCVGVGVGDMLCCRYTRIWLDQCCPRLVERCKDHHIGSRLWAGLRQNSNTSYK